MQRRAICSKHIKTKNTSPDVRGARISFTRPTHKKQLQLQQGGVLNLKSHGQRLSPYYPPAADIGC